MDFEPCFKVYNLVSIRPKSMKLGQMINLNVIFHMVGSVYRLVTIRNSPQFPVEFRNGLFDTFSSPEPPFRLVLWSEKSRRMVGEFGRRSRKRRERTGKEYGCSPSSSNET